MTYEEAIKTIPKGLYHHFKGGTYEVLAIGVYTELEDEAMVIYRNPINYNGPIYVRPASMWNEVVSIPEDGKVFKRFTKI